MKIPYIDPDEICHVELTYVDHPDQLESGALDNLHWQLPEFAAGCYPREVTGQAMIAPAIATALYEAGARVAWATLIPSPAAQKRQARHAQQGDRWSALASKLIRERNEAWAELAKAVEERTQARATAVRHLDKIQSIEAELAELKAKADAERGPTP